MEKSLFLTSISSNYGSEVSQACEKALSQGRCSYFGALVKAIEERENEKVNDFTQLSTTSCGSGASDDELVFDDSVPSQLI